jgi:hypothetical protein
MFESLDCIPVFLYSICHYLGLGGLLIHQLEQTCVVEYRFSYLIRRGEDDWVFWN